MTRRIALIAATCATLLVAGPVFAQPAQDGRIVVRGRVGASESRWDATATLHTYVTVDVTRVVLGSGVPDRIVIKQLGGESGGIGLWVAGQASFAADEDVLLELAARPIDGSLFSAGLARGKWHVETDPSTGTAVASQRGDDGRDIRRPLSDVEMALAAARWPIAVYAAAPPEYSAPRRDAAPLFAFLPTDGGYPARWHEVDSDQQLFVDRAPIPGTWTHALPSHASSAIALWATSGMELDLREGVSNISASACPASFTGNGRITVGFNDPCGNTVNDWVVGGGYYTTGDLRTVNGVTFQKFLQGFAILNESGVQSTAAGCFQDAITHGVGHALGLGHTDSAGAIMQAAPPAGCTTAANGLGADDRTGITAIYQGIASGVSPPNTPTTFSATSALSTVTMQWTPAATGGAAQRYIIDAGSAPGTYNLGVVAVNAPATSTAVGNVPPGTYYVRLRAQNALGTSAPTPERSVTVGACTAPGPPTSFSGSSNDATVNLQWTPPATGVAQGYQVVAGSAPGLANLAVLPVPGTVTSLTQVAPYGTYFVRVQATNVCGTSAPSNEITLVVQPCAAAPQNPTGLTRTVSGGVVTLAWTAGAGATGYTVVAGSAPGLANLRVYPTGTTATSLVTPAPSGTYYVRIIATNACGQSGGSNEVVVVVP